MLGLCWCKCLHVYVWLLCHLTYLHMYCKFRIIASTSHTISSVPHDDMSIDYWIVYKSISINFSTRLRSGRSHGLKWFNMETSNHAQEGTRTLDSDTKFCFESTCKLQVQAVPRTKSATSHFTQRQRPRSVVDRGDTICGVLPLQCLKAMCPVLTCMRVPCCILSRKLSYREWSWI